MKKPVILAILDGWGERPEAVCNAIKAATTPNWDRYWKDLPHAKLSASSLDVGLPDGQMGNSEVGHMTLGSGRVVLQDLPRIDAAIHDGTLDEHPDLLAFIERLKKTGGTCHLLGLLSPGGVHSHHWHMRTLAELVARGGVPVKVHAFLDGRDTPPKSAADYIQRFTVECRRIDGVSIATVCGRFWAMDRDQRWDRVEKAYATMVDALGPVAADAVGAIKAAYDNDISDEFIEPTVIGVPAPMVDGDGILMANFRSDRAREILGALVDPDFKGFKRPRRPEFAGAVGMVDYSDTLKPFITPLFPSLEMNDILSEIISRAGLKQLHTAETEKYAHVTFFFNGGREAPFDGEERILVPSPRVDTYDLKPEMSAVEVTDNIIKAIGSNAYDFIVVNYANGDMVGHTGIMEAAVKAVETVDACLGRLEAAVLDAGGVMVVTADHGNCEKMCHGGQPFTSHTLNLVPVLLIGAPEGAGALADGGLADIAPTVLELLDLDVPAVMSGRSLIRAT